MNRSSKPHIRMDYIVRWLGSALTLISCAFIISSCAGTQGGSGVADTGTSSGGGGGGISFPWRSSGAAKIGYVRSDVVSQQYADYQDADRTLNADNQKWLDQATEMERTIATKERELDEIRLILTEDRLRALEAELVQLRKDMQSFRANTWYNENSTYVKRRKELMSPIDARVNDAIYRVCEEQELDIVFDTVAGNVVYAKPGMDITELVLAELKK